MTTIRKVNRRSGPVRVTQRGTRTTYPHANWRKEEVRTRRYHGQESWPHHNHRAACLTADEVADGIEALLRAAAAIDPGRFYSAARAAEEALA